jgi:hypothetical protein
VLDNPVCGLLCCAGLLCCLLCEARHRQLVTETRLRAALDALGEVAVERALHGLVAGLDEATAARRGPGVRCVWSFRDRSPGKDLRFPFKVSKDGPENSRRIVAMGRSVIKCRPPSARAQ